MIDFTLVECGMKLRLSWLHWCLGVVPDAAALRLAGHFLP